MANISGVFANAKAGRLKVTLTGTFKQGTQRDAGFPSGSNNMLLVGVVNGNQMPAIDRYAAISVGEWDYPGGNANWTIATQVLAISGGGTTAWGFVNLQMVAELVKKTGQP